MAERMSSCGRRVPVPRARTAPQHVGGLACSTPPAGGFDYDRLVRLLEERISLAPRYRQKVRMVPGAPREPGLGRRPELRHHLPRAPLGAAPPGHRRAAARVLRPDPVAAARPLPPAVGDVSRRGAGRAAGSRSSPRPMPRSSASRTASTSPRSSSTPRRRRGARAEPIWMPRARTAVRSTLVRDAVLDVVRRPTRARPTPRAAAARDVRCHGGAARRRWRGGRRPSRRRPLGCCGAAPSSPLRAELGEQRRSRSRAPGSTTTAWCATRSAGRSTTSCSPWSPARCAAGCCRARDAAAVGHHGARARPGQRPDADDDADGRRPMRTDAPRAGGPAVAGRPAGRRARPCAAAGAGAVRDGATSVRTGGRRRPHRRAGRVRAADAARARRTRRRRADPPAVQPGRHQRARPAGAAVRGRRAHDEMFPIVPLTPGQAVSIGLTSYDGGVFTAQRRPRRGAGRRAAGRADRGVAGRARRGDANGRRDAAAASGRGRGAS